MKAIFSLTVILIGLFCPITLSNAQQLQVIGNQPGVGPICAGPLGPGPCAVVQQYLQRQMMQPPPGVAFQPPPPAYQPQMQVIANVAGVGPICNGPLGPGPCAAVQQYLQQLASRAPMPAANLQQVRVIGVAPGVGPLCNGPNGQAPCALLQQAMVDRLGQGAPTLPPLPNVASGSVDAQSIAVNCARQAGLEVSAFASCAGQQMILPEREQAVLDCAVGSQTTENFANCAAPHLGIKLSDDQRMLAGCAMKSNGDEQAFVGCAGAAFLNRNLTPDEQAVLGCAENANGSTSGFASCSVSHLLGAHASKEQQIALECAAQSQGDPTGMATCAGANLFNNTLKLNPEQQIAVQCVVSTGGQPYAAAGCIGTRLTARELTKCFTDGFGGDRGCFGNNNDLFGKNGWTARTLGQVAGGPNSFVRNPGQIWGGDNSFLRNPGQVWGGSNSFVRNPSQIWGGNNSVFNNPGQLLPKPANLGTIGGKRICLPWC